MSSNIEYRHLALAYPTSRVEERWQEATGERTFTCFDREPVYIVLAESGESNVTTSKRINGRNVEVLRRKWNIAAIGTRSAVIAHACRIAPYAEGGMTKLNCAGHSGWVSAEAYIRRYRNTMSRAVDGTTTCQIAGLRVRFFDAEDGVKRCLWLAKARSDGRLTEQPQRYQAADASPSFDTVLTLSTDIATLACDILALSRVFSMQVAYPHFYLEGGSIELSAECAYDRLMLERKYAA